MTENQILKKFKLSGQNNCNFDESSVSSLEFAYPYKFRRG
jgi:hypothetical protein